MLQIYAHNIYCSIYFMLNKYNTIYFFTASYIHTLYI
nr:MAG TPA: hypothetical protein [Caudoviricetes sp.]